MTRDEFRKLRHSTGLTQTKFGEMLGVKRAHVAHIEAGTREISDTLSRLLDAIKDGWRYKG